MISSTNQQEKVIYLHIGTFKTGSSAIQDSLHRNRNRLEELGFFHPVPSNALVGNHDLPISLIKKLSGFRAAWPKIDGVAEEIWQSTFQQISETNCKNIILSSENFCDLMNEHCRNQSAVFGDWLRRFFVGYKVVVIVYIREINQYLHSMYSEMIKVSSQHISYRDWLTVLIKHRSIHIHPSIPIGFFQDLFGIENVIARIYQKDRLLNGDVVSDFFEVIGCNFGSQHHSNDVVNPSLSSDDITLKRVFNLATNEGFEFNSDIANKLISLGSILSQKQTSDPEFQKNLESIIEGENRTIQKYGVFLESLGKEKQTSGDAEVSRSEAFSIMLLSMLLKQNQQIEYLLRKILSRDD